MIRPLAARSLALCLLAAPAMADDAAARLGAAYEGMGLCGFFADDPAHEIVEAFSPVSWSDEPEEITVGLFLCARGAYAESRVVLIDDGFGVRPAAFAAPVLEADYAGEDDQLVTDMRVTGMGAAVEITNPAFDSETGVMTEYGKLRGLGDASVSSEWRLMDMGFVLVRSEADYSYDGEVNPWLVVEDGLPVVPRPLD